MNLRIVIVRKPYIVLAENAVISLGNVGDWDEIGNDLCAAEHQTRSRRTQSLWKIRDSVPAEGLLMIEVSGRIAISRNSRVGSGTVVSSQERKPQALVSGRVFG
jgi:hypothetical protein